MVWLIATYFRNHFHKDPIVGVRRIKDSVLNKKLCKKVELRRSTACLLYAITVERKIIKRFFETKNNSLILK